MHTHNALCLRGRVRALICLGAMVAVLTFPPLSGCQGGSASQSQGNAAHNVPRTGNDAAALLESVARYLPADTIVIASADLSFLDGYGAALFTELFGMSQTELRALRDEVDAFLLDRLGWSIHDIQWGFAAISESQTAILLVRCDMTIRQGLEALPGSAGTKILRFNKDLTLVPLAEQGLYALLFDTASVNWFANRTQTMASPESKARLDHLRAVLERGGTRSTFSVAAVLANTLFGQKLLADVPAPLQRLRAASFTIGERSSVVLHADNRDLVAIRQLLEGLIVQTEGMLKQAHTNLDKLDTAQGLAVIAASHLFKPITKRLMPEVNGEFLVAGGVEGTNTLIAMYITIGVGAAVGVPMFLNYIRESKQAEAKINLKFIGEGALAHFSRETYDPVTGQTISYQYPIVPIKTCISTGGREDRQTTPQPSDFDQSPWRELRFTISKPHYFLYCYQSAADGSRFTATATTTENTFQIQGTKQGNKPIISSVDDISGH